MVIFGALHLVALVLGVVLFMMFLRSDTTSSWKPPEEDEGGGGGGNDRLPSTPKPRPTGGVPLPDAEPAGTRLRDHSKLRDSLPAPAPPAGPPGHAAPRAGAPPLTRQQPPSRSIGPEIASSCDAAAGERPVAPHAHALDDGQRPAGAPRHAGRAGLRRVSESRALGS